MFTALKGVHVVHMIAAKVITTKALIGAGMVVGTVATGFVAQTGLSSDYISGALELIDRSVEVEAPLAQDIPPAVLETMHADGQPPLGVPAPETVTASAQSASAPEPGSTGHTDAAQTQQIPRLIVVAPRMTRSQKAEYDAHEKPASRLAQK